MKKAKIFKVLIPLITLGILAGFTSLSVKADDTIFRYYFSSTGVHWWVPGQKTVLAGGERNMEGVAWVSPGSGTKVYNLISPQDDILITTNLTEVQSLVSKGWHYTLNAMLYEPNVAFYSGGSVPVYRLYNPNAGKHFFTTKVAEKNSLVSLGWKLEKSAAFYVKSGGI